MQKTLDTIIGEHQPQAIKNYFTHSFYYWHNCDITDDSNKLNKNISVISLEFIVSFLLRISLHMETNLFIWISYTNSYPNIESKTKINGILCDTLTLIWVC